ncbi:hypothetical protein FGLOB1_13048 [Fusarium globosum]|uniref:Uncharacterized protein n=1 Tax=Fusarium globosum TaxID=78864 RepID=A0A8H5XND1_9HYPO|nr:hypothetical protein FGLOB1_13048 [Fusarium globosum]
MEHLTEDMIWEPKEYSPMISIYPFGQNVQDGIKYTVAMDPRYTVTPIIIIAAFWYHYNWYWNHRAKWTIPVGVYFLFCSAQVMLVMCGFSVFMDAFISAAIIFLACVLLAGVVVVGLVIVGLVWYLIKGGSLLGHIWSTLLLMAGNALGCAASEAGSLADNLDQWRAYVLAKVIGVFYSVWLYLNSTPHSPTGGSSDGSSDGSSGSPEHRPNHRHQDGSEGEIQDGPEVELHDGPEGELQDESEDEPEDDRVRDPDYVPDRRQINQTGPHPRRSTRNHPQPPREFRHYTV